MKKYKVIIDRRKCIACAICVSLVPDVFSLATDGQIQSNGFIEKNGLLVGEIEESQLLAVQQAAQACTESVIKIEAVK